MRYFFFLVFAFIWPQQIVDLYLPKEFVVWNIGQGQWTTWIDSPTCHHFDIGGEFNASNKVLQRCQKLENRIYISHWDRDHWSFLPAFTRMTRKACLYPPTYGTPPPILKKTLSLLPNCSTLDANLALIYSGTPSKKIEKNPNSQVFLIQAPRILIPGDSTIPDEKKWVRFVSNQALLGWVLGHHGSKTSTSEQSLNHFKSVQWVVASSRFKRYGHPHGKVVALLRKKRIPLLKTEDWGDLHFIF